MIGVIAEYNFRRLLSTPKSWLLFMLQAVVQFWIYHTLLQDFSLQQQAGVLEATPQLGFTALVLHPYFAWVSVIYLITIPIIGSHLIADERQRHSLLLYTTAPISSTAVLMGFYLSLVMMLAMSLLITLLPILPIVLHVDKTHVICQFLGLFFLSLSAGSVSLFCSSVARQPTSATLMALSILGGLALISWISPHHQGFLGTLGLLSHLQAFLQGIYSSVHVAYFLLLAFLALTTSTLYLSWEAERG